MGKEYETFSGTMQNIRKPELFDVWIRHENQLEYTRELDGEDLQVLRNAIDEMLIEIGKVGTEIQEWLAI